MCVLVTETGQKLFKTAHNLVSATRKAYSHACGRPWATNDGTHMGRKTYVFVHKTPQKRLFAGSSGRKRPRRVTKLHPSLPGPRAALSGQGYQSDLNRPGRLGMVLGRVAGRFGSVWVGFWVGLGRFQTQIFFFRQLLFGPKKKKNFFFSGLRLGPGAPKNAKKGKILMF